MSTAKRVGLVVPRWWVGGGGIEKNILDGQTGQSQSQIQCQSESQIKWAAANIKCTQTEELILIDNLTSAIFDAFAFV